MATETRRKKNTLDDDNDPPIIISGGGGVSKETFAQNIIHIDYDEPGSARKKIRAKANAQPHITGVRVVVSGKSGSTTRERTLDFPFLFENYQATVTFLTGPAIRKPVKGGSASTAKKAYSKASTARKKTK